MKARSFSPVIALSLTLLLSSVALAQPAPTVPALPAKVTTNKPALTTTTGLAATSSSPIGLVAPTPAQVQQYIQAVSAVNVAADYQNQTAVNVDKQLSLPFGWKPTVSAVSMAAGADVKLTASYTKQNGSPEATLQDVKLDATGVTVGPHIGDLGIHVTSAEINAAGEIKLKLNSWIPQFTITKVEKQANGDVDLKGDWHSPDVIIKANGDVEVGKSVDILGWKHDFMATVGHIDPSMLQVFNVWPPTVETLAAVAAVPSASSGLIKQLAGKLSWDVSAKTDKVAVPVAGSKLDASVQAELKGQAELANGHIATIGSNNTANLSLDFGGSQLANGADSADVKNGVVNLSGAYRISAPLANAKAMQVEFNGNASYSLDGDNVQLALPSGAKVSLADLHLDGSNAVGVNMNGVGNDKFTLGDAHYNAKLSGPLTIEKLGGIQSLALNGDLTSSGIARVSGAGLASVTGNLAGNYTVQSGGAINALEGGKGFFSAGFTPGSQVSVNLANVSGAVQLPVDGSSTALTSANARGTVAIHGAIGDTEIQTATATVNAPGSKIDATLNGQISDKNGVITETGQVTGAASLTAPASVALNTSGSRVTTTIDSGTRVGLDASLVNGNPAAPAPAASNVVTVNAPPGLNARSAPNAGSPVVKVLANGTKLTLEGPMGLWAHVKDASGASTWVLSQYLTRSAPAVAAAPTTESLKGTLSGTVGVTNANILTGSVNGAVNGHATVGLNAPFDAELGTNGKVTVTGSAKIPVRIELHKGSTLTILGQSITIQDDLDYIQVTGNVALGPDGKPVLQSLQNVDVVLELGDLTAKIVGQQLNVPPLAKVHLTGDVTFAATGIQVHGNASAVIAGQTAPIFNINF
jgi:hypothetical protein